MLSVFPVIAFIMLVLKPGFLPKARRSTRVGETPSALDLWRVPRLRKTFIASGIISSAWDLFQFYFPVYGHSVGLSASAIGAVLGVFALATFTIRIVLPPLARRYSEAVNNFMHLLIPLAFGSLGAAFGFTLVFVSNSGLLVAGGVLMRQATIAPAAKP